MAKQTFTITMDTHDAHILIQNLEQQRMRVQTEANIERMNANNNAAVELDDQAAGIDGLIKTLIDAGMKPYKRSGLLTALESRYPYIYTCAPETAND